MRAECLFLAFSLLLVPPPFHRFGLMGLGRVRTFHFFDALSIARHGLLGQGFLMSHFIRLLGTLEVSSGTVLMTLRFGHELLGS